MAQAMRDMRPRGAIRFIKADASPSDRRVARLSGVYIARNFFRGLSGLKTAAYAAWAKRLALRQRSAKQFVSIGTLRRSHITREAGQKGDTAFYPNA
jgi:hypothetical protein